MIRAVVGVPEFAGDLYATIVTISDREFFAFSYSSSANIQRSLRGEHPTSSTHFLLRSHFDSTLPHRCDGIPCEEQPRPRSRLH
jgi:hypothetical protein